MNKYASYICLTTVLTHHPASWIRVSFEKLMVAQLVKFLTFYGTWRFIIVLTRVFYLSLSWARWIQFRTSHHIFWPILIFTSLCLSTSGFPTNTFHVHFLSDPYMFPTHRVSRFYQPMWMQIVKVCILKFSVASYCFLILWLKYSLKHFVIQTPRHVIFLNVRD